MKLSPEALERWKAGYRVVNEVVMAEQAALSVDQRLDEATMLYRAAKEFGWLDAMEQEAQSARTRWQKLKSAHNELRGKPGR